MALVARITDTQTGTTTEVTVTDLGYVAAHRGRKNRGPLRAYRGRPSLTPERVQATIDAAKIDAHGRRNPAKRRSDVVARILLTENGQTILTEA